MSATAIIRALLTGYAPVLALVPAARIVAGIIPQGMVLPAISITEVDCYEDQTVARRQATTQQRARVQVTVVTKSYASQKQIMLAAKLGPGTHTGMVAGFLVKSVLPGGTGPDLNNLDDDGIYEQSRDFLVTFSEPN